MSTSFTIQSDSYPALEPVSLRPGSLSVGRGPLLRVTDRSVSRSHAELSLDPDTDKLAIRSVHTNPTFVYKVGSDKTVVLSKGQEIELSGGDKFSFLPEKLVFRVFSSGKVCSSSEQTLYLPMVSEIDATQPIDGDLVQLASADIDRSETLYLPTGSEIDATQPIDGDLVQLASVDIDRSETLYLPTGSEIDATQPIDGDLVELASADIDRSETLYLPMVSEIDATQPIDGDLVQLASVDIERSETLYLPTGSEIDATQPIDGDLVELASADIDRSETLYLPMGSEIDATQPIDGDLVQLASVDIDRSETLYLPMGSEIDATQPIDGDLVELASADIDRSETLYLPMGSEIDATQPIDGDLVQLASVDIERSETLYLPTGSEIDATQPIDGDLVQLASVDIDRSETLYLPMGSEIDATQPIDGDLVELASADIERSEMLYLPMGSEIDATQPIDGDLVQLASVDIDRSETLTETVKELNSNYMDSESSASQHIPHKKRKLPLWMLEDAKPDVPTSKKTKPSRAPTSSKSLSKGSPSLGGDSSPIKPLLPVASDSCISSSKDPRDATSPFLPLDSATVRLESSVADSSIPTPAPAPEPSDEIASTALPTCPYGADCYRKNPVHLKNYTHPPKEDKGRYSTATKECPHGSKCYRKNPDHLKEFSHLPRASARERKPRAAKDKKRSLLDGASDDDGEGNSYDLRDDFIDDSGSSDESASTGVESSESEEWRPAEEVSDLLTEANDFVRNPKMIRK